MKSAKRTIPYPPTCPPKLWRRWKRLAKRIVAGTSPAALTETEFEEGLT